ncbi:2C-methyl-D-erythritol 2,4-cyclodiphosphate synthase [Pseudomonas lurida]
MGAGDVIAATQVDHAFGGGQRLGLDGLDIAQQAGLLGAGGSVGEQAIHARGGVLVIALELVDLGQVAVERRLILDQYRVANGDGAVVHAATEVDRVALDHGGFFTDVLECAVDKTHALNTHGGDQHE